MSTSPSTGAAPAVRRTAGVLAWLVALGVLLQSVFAGGFLSPVYGGDGLAGALTWHEVGANGTFGLLVVEGLLVLATPLAVLLTAVIGLGYVGGGSVALHVPLAVAAFGVALWHALVASGRRFVRVDQR